MVKEKILSTVRELIFDNYPIHTLTLGERVGSKFSLSKDELKITKESPSPGTVELQTVMTDKAFGDLFEALIGGNITCSFTGSYRVDEPMTSVITMTNAVMDSQVKVFTKSFYSDATILAFVKAYLVKFLGYEESSISDDTGFETIIEEFDGNVLEHLCLFVAIMLVDYRRVFAYAQTIFDGSTFSNGDGTDVAGNITADLDSITVNIGDVFSLNDAGDYQSKFPNNDDGTKIGSENFFGDTNSFWYRLFLWLRDRLEQRFSDFSFRKNNGLWSTARLDKPLSYFQYFDSYPYPEQARQVRRGFSPTGD